MRAATGRRYMAPVVFLVAACLGLIAIRLSAPAGTSSVANSQDRLAGQESTTPAIRVLLGRPRETLDVQVDGPYWITPLDMPTRILAQGDRLAKTVVRSHRQGLQVGDTVLPVDQIQLVAHRDGTLWVSKRRYRGQLRVFTTADGLLRAINRVDLESYLASVVSCEMPPSFPDAARQAQLIAARSYAMFHMKTFGAENDWDVYDSSRSQNYRGAEEIDQQGRHLAVETPATQALVEQTRGIVLVYRDRLFCTYYSAVCGGHTATGASVFGQAAPPLSGVACQMCGEAPNYRWQRELSLAEVETGLKPYFQSRAIDLGRLTTVTVTDPGAGIVPTAKLVGSQQTHRMPTTTLREYALAGKVPSHLFTTQAAGDVLRFSGRGWGHGVGMCQWGSRAMAARGDSAIAILEHYYPQSRLIKVH